MPREHVVAVVLLTASACGSAMPAEPRVDAICARVLEPGVGVVNRREAVHTLASAPPLKADVSTIWICTDLKVCRKAYRQNDNGALGFAWDRANNLQIATTSDAYRLFEIPAKGRMIPPRVVVRRVQEIAPAMADLRSAAPALRYVAEPDTGCSSVLRFLEE
jgi:hypothetical protein